MSNKEPSNVLALGFPTFCVATNNNKYFQVMSAERVVKPNGKKGYERKLVGVFLNDGTKTGPIVFKSEFIEQHPLLKKGWITRQGSGQYCYVMIRDGEKLPQEQISYAAIVNSHKSHRAFENMSEQAKNKLVMDSQNRARKADDMSLGAGDNVSGADSSYANVAGADCACPERANADSVRAYCAGTDDVNADGAGAEVNENTAMSAMADAAMVALVDNAKIDGSHCTCGPQEHAIKIHPSLVQQYQTQLWQESLNKFVPLAPIPHQGTAYQTAMAPSGAVQPGQVQFASVQSAQAKSDQAKYVYGSSVAPGSQSSTVSGNTQVGYAQTNHTQFAAAQSGYALSVSAQTIQAKSVQTQSFQAQTAQSQFVQPHSSSMVQQWQLVQQGQVSAQAQLDSQEPGLQGFQGQVSPVVYCPVEMSLSLLGGKYKALILWKLLECGTLRFLQLNRLIPKATAKILTQQLRELEANGLVRRTVYPVVPPKVEYSLTALGVTIQPLLEAMYRWGSQYLQRSGHQVNCTMSMFSSNLPKIETPVAFNTSQTVPAQTAQTGQAEQMAQATQTEQKEQTEQTSSTSAQTHAATLVAPTSLVTAATPATSADVVNTATMTHPVPGTAANFVNAVGVVSIDCVAKKEVVNPTGIASQTNPGVQTQLAGQQQTQFTHSRLQVPSAKAAKTVSPTKTAKKLRQQ